MAIRLHELHPMMTHFPIVLMPLSVASDVAGSMTGSSLMRGMGRVAMPMALTSMAFAAVTGVVAQEGVKVSRKPGVAQDFLTTHRNMNVVLFGVTAALTMMRMRQKRPNGLYYTLAAGAGAAMVYSAYLGGEMVHHYGVGVEAAQGVDFERSPEFKRKNAGKIVRTVFGNLSSGLARSARILFRGPRFPAVGEHSARQQASVASDESRYYYSEKMSDFDSLEEQDAADHHRYSDDDFSGLHS